MSCFLLQKGNNPRFSNKIIFNLNPSSSSLSQSSQESFAAWSTSLWTPRVSPAFTKSSPQIFAVTMYATIGAFYNTSSSFLFSSSPIIYSTFSSFFLIITRDMEAIYPFSSDLTWIAVIMYLFSLAQDIFYYFVQYYGLKNGDITIYLIGIVVLRDIAQFYLMIVRQLYRAQAYHLVMPTSLKLTDDVERFIEDELCYKLFYSFCEYKAKEEEKLRVKKNMGSQLSLQLLNFLSRVIIIDRIETDDQTAKVRRLFEQYVVNEDLFPPQIRESILGKIDNAIVYEEKQYIQVLSDAIGFAYENLNRKLGDYKRTNSARALKRILERNERNYERLGLFGMY